MRIAIYDLDRTLTRRPTFTPFLMFAARRLAPWRLVLAPVWILAMLTYRAGLFSRTALKRFGLKLMLGRASRQDLSPIGAQFAAARINRDGLWPAIRSMVDADRAAGARVLLATAAFEFYAAAFAKAMGIDDVVATRWSGADIPGGNCYGAVKKARVMEWCSGQGLDLAAAETRFVTDSFADAPLLDAVTEPVFITADKHAAAKARLRGWAVRDPSS